MRRENNGMEWKHCNNKIVLNSYTTIHMGHQVFIASPSTCSPPPLISFFYKSLASFACTANVKQFKRSQRRNTKNHSQIYNVNSGLPPSSAPLLPTNQQTVSYRSENVWNEIWNGRRFNCFTLLLLPPCPVCIVFVECEKQFSVIFVFVLQTANWFGLGSDRFGYGSAQLQCGPGCVYRCVCADNFQHLQPFLFAVLGRAASDQRPASRALFVVKHFLAHWRLFTCASLCLIGLWAVGITH